MKKKFMVLSAVLSIILTNITYAGSLYNNDSIPYSVSIKDANGLNTMELYPNSTEYFDCTYGCEIKLIKTGQTIKLESDADVLIDGGELRTR